MPRGKSSTESTWSEWIWDKKREKYYAERPNGKGGYDIKWDDSSSTPRTNDVEEITAGLANYDIDQPDNRHGQGDPYNPGGNSSMDDSSSGLSASPQYTHNAGYHDASDYMTSQKDKGKAVAHPTSYDANFDRDHGPLTSYSTLGGYYGYTESPTQNVGGFAETTTFSSGGSGENGNPNYSVPSDDENELEVQKAMKISRDELLGGGRPGESSIFKTTYQPQSVYPGTYSLPTSTQDGDTTPRGAQFSNPSNVPNLLGFDYYISGTPGYEEQLDPRFVVERSHRYQPGEVFKILWSEPLGQVMADLPVSDVRTMQGPNKQFYVGYRRFIIVSTDESHHSTCVPVLTYDRQGCGKKGVRPNKHGIIYARGQKPKLLKKEPELGFPAVQLDIYAEGETLAKESRVNYSKLVTIEHNVKVFFIGSIPFSHFAIVQNAVNDCWNAKLHNSNKSNKKTKR